MVAQRHITDDTLLDLYHCQGVVLLAHTILPQTLHTLRQSFSRCLDQPTPLAHHYEHYYHDSFLHICFEDLFNLTDQLPLLPFIIRAMQTHQLTLFNIELAVKVTDGAYMRRWHTTINDWPLSGSQFATLCIPLDPIDLQTGGFEFDTEPNQSTTYWQLEPGDAILYSGQVPHREYANHKKDFDRKIILLRFAGDDICYQPKPFANPLIWSPELNINEPIHNDTLLFPHLNISSIR